MASEAWKINVGVKLNTSSVQSDLNKALKSTTVSVGVKSDGSISKTTSETTKLNNTTQDVINTYQVFSQILNKSISVVKSMASATMELDSAMTELKKVSDLNGESLDEYVSNLTRVGQTVARTGSEMVSAAASFRKSGFSDADAATLAKVAAQYQNVADTAVSAEDAASSIVSQIRAFGEDASFATEVIDAYNEVANNFSVGTNDLSQAMEVASSSMVTYGNEFSQVLGLVTAGTEIMQGRSLICGLR